MNGLKQHHAEEHASEKIKDLSAGARHTDERRQHDREQNLARQRRSADPDGDGGGGSRGGGDGGYGGGGSNTYDADGNGYDDARYDDGSGGGTGITGKLLRGGAYATGSLVSMTARNLKNAAVNTANAVGEAGGSLRDGYSDN